MPKAQTITIDKVEYPLEALSKEAKQQIGNLRIVDEEIKQLQIKLNIAQTARAVFARGIKNNLPAADKK